jgi:predicted MPP superfamily phosphohydrolase
MQRWTTFLIFFTVFLSVYGSINYYIFRRGWQCLPDSVRVKRAYWVLFVVVATSYIASRFLESRFDMWITPAFTWIGSVWFGIMSYLFLIILAIDLARLGNLAFHYFPKSWAANPQRVHMLTAAIVLGVVLLASLIGCINAAFVHTREVNISVAKRAGEVTQLRMVMASDLHIGSVVGPCRLKRIVDAINAQEADIVLLAGDIVDEGVKPDRDPVICELLRSIRAKYGVYGCTGNHEFIVGIERSLPFLTACGIRMLRDETVLVADGFYVAARDDWSGRHFAGRGRADLEEILRDVDRAFPIILMDHSPMRLDDAMVSGVDLQLSGHTHNGQLWPFNYITGAVFEQDWGYLKKGDTHYYVSCGAGTWGPPVRTNSRSEVVVINLTFDAGSAP